jgi:vacuolar-type H+-ATPase subunit I/STV1
MILESAGHAQNELVAIQNHRRNKSEIGNIGDTLSALRHLNGQLDLFAAQYGAVEYLLDAPQAESIQRSCTHLLSRVQRSRQDFEINRRQVRLLQDVSEDLRQLERNLGVIWRSHVENLVRSRELNYQLVERFSEMSQRRRGVEKLLETTKACAGQVPDGKEKLAEFKSLLDKLDRALVDVHNLSPEIKEFLNKARAGTCTVDHLTDEILAWCREDPSRARRLKIGF